MVSTNASKVARKSVEYTEHFHAGEYIFEEGDFGNKLYMVVRGKLEIIKHGEIIAVACENEVFGETALVSEQSRTASVRAKTDLDVISLTRLAFQNLFVHLPGVRASVGEILKSHGRALPKQTAE